MQLRGKSTFSIILIFANVSNNFELTLQYNFCQLALKSFNHCQNSPKLGQKEGKICFVFVTVKLRMEKIVMTEFEFVYLLYDFICPFLVIIYLINMPMCVLSETTLTEIAVMGTISFGAVIPSLLLMDLTFLVNTFTHVFQFVQSAEFLSLHLLPATYRLKFKVFINSIPKAITIFKMIQAKKSIHSKKADLFEQLKQKQTKYRRQIEQLEEQANQVHSKIVRECEQLNSTTKKLKEKAEEFIKNCVQSLQVQFIGKEMINIKQLANYLKVQKQMLVKLSSKQKSNATKDFDLHLLLSKSKFEQTLRKIKKIQLQEEIKYLQTNVLVKNNIVYNAAASNLIPASQQKQINSRLETLINELQRVINLSINCISHEDQSDKVLQLQRQTGRLKQCQSLLLTEYEKLSKLMKYFQSQCLNIPAKLPSFQRKSLISTQTTQITAWEHKRVYQYQLDEINSLQLPQSMLIGKYQHSFDACEQKIDVIRKKFKQFENLAK